MAVQPDNPPGVWGTRAKVVLGAFVAIAAFFLIAEHRAHVLPYVPWLLVAACPLMHLFMRGHHGEHGGHEPTRDEASGRPEAKAGGSHNHHAGGQT